MKKSKLVAKTVDEELKRWELVYTFNEKVIAVIPLGEDEETIQAGMYLVSAFNKAQPEE